MVEDQERRLQAGTRPIRALPAVRRGEAEMNHSGRLSLFAISIATFVATAVATRAFAGESPTLRAAGAGVSPGFCSALQTLIDAAGKDFATLRGRARGGSEHVWEGTKRLPGATDCSVYGGRPSAYTCTLYAGDVEDNADGTYEHAVSGLKDCLPASWKTTERIDGTHARTTTAVGGGRPQLRIVLRDASADAYLVELWVDAGTR